MKNNHVNLDPWYVTGLCEGEGSFNYNTSGGRITLVFAVKFTKTESVLLGKLQKFFGVGKIYNVKPIAPKSNSGYTKASLYYKVHALRDFDRIIEHFEQYPIVGEKRKRYRIWKEMVSLKKKNYKKMKIPETDAQYLRDLARQLSRLAPKNIPWDGDTSQLR